jgi:hypothetical protein
MLKINPTMLNRLAELEHDLTDDVANQIVRCALAFVGLGLGLGLDRDLRMAETLFIVLMPDLITVDRVLGVDALARLAELDLPVPRVRQLEHPDELYDLVASVAHQRPDLADHLRRITDQPPSDPGRADPQLPFDSTASSIGEGAFGGADRAVAVTQRSGAAVHCPHATIAGAGR